MRLDSTLNLRRIGGKYMIVKAVGGKANMTDVITLNETAALLWERFLRHGLHGGGDGGMSLRRV